MESTTSMPWLSWPQKPRRGQEAAFLWACDTSKAALNIKFPTAYGKTMVANGCLTLLWRAGRINRAFLLVPQEGQHDQYTRTCTTDFADVGMIYGRDVIVLDLRNQSYNDITQAILKNRSKLIVYITTIQMLHAHTRPKGRDAPRRELLREILGEPDTKWAYVIDEYHHYGEGKAWAEAFARLPQPVFRLAMSATPYRPDQDEFFGQPDIQIRYRIAVGEQAVKPLVCHVYDYWIEMEGANGRVRMTTRQHDERMANQEQLPRAEITLPLRYREDYISPLLEIPLDRLIKTRATQHAWAQAIIYCARIDHAEHVHTILDGMFGDALRTAVIVADPAHAEANGSVLEKFCPVKGDAPELDVLVCVGMAGEGLNTIYVTEIIHLNGETTISNTGNQKKGRAARVLRHQHNGKMLTGHINVDGSSAYRRFVGERIMDAMEIGGLPQADTPSPPDPEFQPDDDVDVEEDLEGIDPTDIDDDEDDGEDDPDYVPPEPILPATADGLPTLEMGLDGIDTGEQYVMADAIADPRSPIHMSKFSPADLEPDAPNHEELMAAAAEILRKHKRRSPANEAAERARLRSVIEMATAEAARRACFLMHADPQVFKGRIKHEIHTHRIRKLRVPVKKASINELRRHYDTTMEIDIEMALTLTVPPWLRSAFRM